MTIKACDIDLASSKILSIVVAAHNLEKLILRCINSIRNALSDCDPSLYEVLLIDDSSSDSTPSILRKFSEENDSFIYIRKEFKSLGKVKKYSVEVSNGEYITFVDGDDFLSEFSMKEIVDFLMDKRPDMLISPLQEVRNDADIIHKSSLISPVLFDKKTAIKEYLIHKKYQAHSCGKFFRKKLLRGNNFPEVSCYEDALSFPAVLIKCNKVYYTKMKYYNYIKSEGSLSGDINEEKINLMADVVLTADRVFGKEFRMLTVCHAIDIIYKYRNNLSRKSHSLLMGLINSISVLNFMLNTNVRFSFKKKYYKIRNYLKN
ncbi:glycosyltransferase family 2 protein [Xenorhabdus bovienii]|uniref:glycosyltransferase family 2 protein n=1 Tax=Xenorhabdus bovienii TaxID=40576 RepID=UPI0023B2D4C7|nr:glycosyltransferase family 2 protein [Xenorhabdus bovienii]MDE9428643.1 glycosyltransferase [Xenorhabdus bovienii]MDE9466080.1 glycosyltransferase [Xenorhabdus bovienii]